MAFVESIDDYFNEFAKPATWQSQTVQVIFDNAYIESYNVRGTNPFVTVPLVNMPGVAVGQTMVVDSVTYTIRNILPDGTGIVQLELEQN